MNIDEIERLKGDEAFFQAYASKRLKAYEDEAATLRWSLAQSQEKVAEYEAALDGLQAQKVVLEKRVRDAEASRASWEFKALHAISMRAIDAGIACKFQGKTLTDWKLELDKLTERFCDLTQSGNDEDICRSHEVGKQMDYASCVCEVLREHERVGTHDQIKCNDDEEEDEE